MSEKKYGVGVQIAALSVALLMYTTSMTTPALAEIAKAFPTAAPETVKLLSTIPVSYTHLDVYKRQGLPRRG